MKKVFKKRALQVGVASLMLLLIGSVWYFYRAMPTFLGYSAKTLCTGVFVSQRPPQAVVQDIAPMLVMPGMVQNHIDTTERVATASLWGFSRRQALYREGCGCTLVVNTTVEALRRQKNQCVRPTSTDDDPLTSSWPKGLRTDDPTVSPVQRQRLDRALDRAFAEPFEEKNRNTRAVVVVHKGRLVAERYAPGFHPAMALPGWSMSKSVVNALVGILVQKGFLRLNEPAPVPEWQGKQDRRRQITLNHLLRMSSGLRFSEVYAPPSDVTDMLFDSTDFGAIAAAKPLTAAPGTRWHYSSGTTNIIARIVRRVVEANQGRIDAFACRQLFEKLHMTSVVMEIDPSGTFVGSSYILASARDWARFGLLYLRDGVWAGEQILPPGWVAYTRTPAPAASRGQYGAHFWLNVGHHGDPSTRPWPRLPADTFYARGFQGQSLTIIGSEDLVLVRLGHTVDPAAWNYGDFVESILAALGKGAPS